MSTPERKAHPGLNVAGAAHPTDFLSRTRERVRVRARALRQSLTDADRLLWHHLRGRRFSGHKFRRQFPIGRFFVDFACVEARLVIELDGGQHFELAAVEADASRSAALRANGLHVLRFDNRQALAQTDTVLASIHDWLALNHPHPNPLPRAGEGAKDKELPDG